jgi:hypothetical protein
MPNLPIPASLFLIATGEADAAIPNGGAVERETVNRGRAAACRQAVARRT